MPSFEFDAWAGMTPEQLKADARRSSRALYMWQHIALALATPEQVARLPKQWQDKINNLVAAYED